AEQQVGIDEVLLAQRGGKARIELRTESGGSMALRAVGIDPGSHPMLHARGLVINRSRMEKRGDLTLFRRWIEHAKMSKRAELVIGAAGGGVSENAILLVGFQPKHVAGRRIMAEEALLAARVTPFLDSHCPRDGRDAEIFIETGCRKKVGLAVIRTPPIGHTVNFAIRIADEKSSLKSFPCAGYFVHDQFKILHENGPVRERPFASGGKPDLFGRAVRRTVVREGDPACFDGTIRPEGRIHRKRNKARSWSQCSQVAECAGGGEQEWKWKRAGG